MKNFTIFLILVFTLHSCHEKIENQDTDKPSLEVGKYRATLEVKDSKELPFIFEVFSEDSLVIYNADEKIEVTDIKYQNDSIYIYMPVFEGYLIASCKDSELKGNFINESLDRSVPFSAIKGDFNRFSKKLEAKVDVSGSWETSFSKGSDNEYKAKGIFKQTGDSVSGTFRTSTGDYRFLEGVVDGNILKLSTFDGSHAFLFEAEVDDSTMIGTFYSGNHWKESFEARRNENFELPNANELTYLKEGYDSLNFTFPDLNGSAVSLSDSTYKEKVVIVQIMGSWCPNCLDETRYYVDYFNSDKPENVEFLALAFEYAKSEDLAKERLRKLQKDVSIPYPILLAQTGSSSKAEAQKKLPMLNQVLSYPTTIFVDKKGKVRKIHTGFNGPATGEKYQEFQEEFTTFVEILSKE